MMNTERRAPNRSRRMILLTLAVALVAVGLWPGQSWSVFQEGVDPHIEEGWAFTGTASSNSSECSAGQEVCVEWCRVIDGETMPISGAVCCVASNKVDNNNYGDCLRRVD